VPIRVAFHVRKDFFGGFRYVNPTFGMIIRFHAKIIQPAASETLKLCDGAHFTVLFNTFGGESNRYFLVSRVPSLANFQDGPLTVEVTVESTLSISAPCNTPVFITPPSPPIPTKFTPATRPAGFSGPPTHSFTTRVSSTLLPVEAIKDQRFPVSDPTFAANLANAVTTPRMSSTFGTCFLDVEIPSLPANIAHDVFIVHNNTEDPIGTLTALRGAVSLVNFSPLRQSAPPTPPLPPTVTLVFRPNPSAALTTVDLTSCADTTFTLENVPFIIGPTFPTTAPTTTPTTTPTP